MYVLYIVLNDHIYKCNTLLIVNMMMNLSATATIVIDIGDVNDNPPVFQEKIYRATMSESYPIGTSVTSVKATDKDMGVNAQLKYTLKESDRKYFAMSSVTATNTGVLKVHNVSFYQVGVLKDNYL